jgi:hypothetical protein
VRVRQALHDGLGLHETEYVRTDELGPSPRLHIKGVRHPSPPPSECLVIGWSSNLDDDDLRTLDDLLFVGLGHLGVGKVEEPSDFAAVIIRKFLIKLVHV